MIITLPIKLADNLVPTDENNLGLAFFTRAGLVLETGATYYSDLSYTPFSQASINAQIATLSEPRAKTLSTALYQSIPLVAGETLTITFNYANNDKSNDDYAFALIGMGSADLNAAKLIDKAVVARLGGTVDTVYANTITVNKTGTYSLLIGDAGAGDAFNSALTIQSLTITVPDKGPAAYTVLPDGIRLADGSEFLANGDGRLADGTALPNLLSDGSQLILASLISQDGGGIVSHDAGGIVSHDAGGIVSHDAGGIVSHDAGGLTQIGGSLISQDGGGLISQDGGGLISQDGGGLISQDGGGLISQDGGGIVSHDAGGLINAGNGLLIRTGNALKSADIAAFPVLTLPAPKPIGGDLTIGLVAPGHQNDPQVAALSGYTFVTVWSDDTSGRTIIRGQISNDADGSASGSYFNVSTDTGADQIKPSVATLANGNFVVAWLGTRTDGNAVHTQIFTPTGTKIGAEQHVGFIALLNNAVQSNLKVVATTDGGFSTVYEISGNGGGNDATLLFGQRYDRSGTPGETFAVGDINNGAAKSSTAVTALADGAIAVAYREVNANAGRTDHDGIFLDVIARDGSSTASEIPVNATTSGTQDSPALATLKNGNFVVAWVDNGTSNGAGLGTVRAQIFSAKGVKVGGEYQIADTLVGADAPSVAALADGTFSVTWSSPVSSGGKVVGSNISGRIFTPDGTGEGPIFTVNTPSADNSLRDAEPASVSLRNGSLVVVGSVIKGGNSTIHANLLDIGATTAVPVLPTPPTGPTPTQPLVPITPAAIKLTRLATPVDLGGQNAVAVVAADLNGDGVADLVSVGGDIFDALVGKGDGTFALVNHFGIGGSPTSLALADLNGDGKIDAVVGTASNTIAATYLGNANGNFSDLSATDFYQSARLYFKLNAVDVTGDGIIDLVNGYNDGVFIAKGNGANGKGDGSFQTPTLLATNTAVTNVVVADFNGDGRPDIAAAEPNAMAIAVFLSTGNGLFAPAVKYAVGSNVTPLAFGDVNGDGILDLIGGNSSGNIIENDLSVLLGKGDGTFGSQIKVPQLVSSTAIAVGDLNGDGYADIVSTDGGNSGTVTVFLSRGDGTFAAQTPVSVGGSLPTSVTLVDVDGDHRPDIVVGYGTGNGTGLDVILNTAVVTPPPVVFTPKKIGVEFPVALGAQTANLLALKNGNFATVTATSAGYSNVPVLQIFDPRGFKVGAAVQLDTVTAHQPVATVLSDGRIATAYDKGNVIYGIISNPDGTTSVPTFTIKSTTDAGWYVNSIGALSGNRFAIAESSYNSSVGGLTGMIQVLDGSGTTVVPTLKAFPDFSGNGANLDIKELSDGRVAVLGRGANDPSERAIVYSSDFSTSTTEILASNTNYSNTGGDSASQIAVLANGNFVALFRPAIKNAPPRTDSSSVGLRGQVFKPDGTPVSGQFTLPGLASDPDQGQASQTVVALPDGGFVVAFRGHDGPTTGNGGYTNAVEMQRYNDDGSRNGDLVITSIDRGQYTSGDPKLAVLQNGNLVLTFNGSQDDTGQIFALAANVPAALPPVVLTRTTTNPVADAAPDTMAAGQFFTGDANVDLVTADTYTSIANGNSIAVLKGNGDGTFTRVGAPIAVSGPVGIKVADVNNDGKSDLVVADNGQGSLQVLIGGGDGTFKASAPISVNAPYGYGPRDVAVADLNTDGNTDIITANGDNTVSLFIGDGTGGFKETDLTGTVGSRFSTILTGDLNGDGRIDFVALSPTGTSQTSFIAKADGSYIVKPGADLGLYDPNRGVLADINNDGKLDLVTSTGQGNAVNIQLGQGDGTFSAPQTNLVGGSPSGVAVGDLNGDGKQDIVVANTADNTITVLLGYGDGTFVAQTPIAVGGSPKAVSIVDVNGDGKKDVAVTNFADGTVSVLLNATVLAPMGTIAAGGSTPLSTPSVVDPATKTSSTSFVDAYGHTVTDTLGAGGKLLKEVIVDTITGALLSTNTLTYKSDGTYTQHSELVTTTGSLTTDVAYGPKGELSETLRDETGAITSTALVTYNADGTVGRHTTTVGRPGSDDFVYAGPSGGGAFVSHTYTDASGTVTRIDVNGKVIDGSTPTDTTPPSVTITSTGGATTTVMHVVAGTVSADAGPTVTLRDGATIVGTATVDTNFGWSTSITLTSDGTHTIVATDADAAGNIGQASIVFKLDSTVNRSLFGDVTHDVTSPGGNIYGLYEAILGRAPDVTGLAGWVAALSAGEPLALVAQSFLDSPEYTTRPGATGSSDGDFVESLYRNGLHRASDKGGFDGWTKALANGTLTRAQVAINFALSPEGQGDLAPVFADGVFIQSATDTAIAQLYHGLFGRAPDAGGLAGWEDYAKTGASFTAIADGFVHSAEFSLAHGAQNNSEFVHALYDGALGRNGAGDPGVQGWVSALDAGATRTSVAIGIVESAEAGGHLAPAIAAFHIA